MTDDARASVREMVAEMIAEIRGHSQPIDESTALATLGIDSFDLIEIVLMLSQQWSIHLSAEDYDALLTVGDLVALATPSRHYDSLGFAFRAYPRQPPSTLLH